MTPHVERVVPDALSNVKRKYVLMEVIGRGTFGIVRKCMKKKTKELFAVKTILKSQVENMEVLRREVSILAEVDHPHIIKLEDVYEDDKYLHLVTELCTGGELYDRVIEKASSSEKHYSEYDAARIIRNILDALAYCHDVKHIVHRDLKAENFLLLNKRDDAPVKIIDFGLSRHDYGIMRSRVGTPYYVAPEVLTDDYTNKCDVWSVGVLSYILLSGHTPFLGENDKRTLELVQTADVDFPSPDWDDISDTAKAFILHLLERDPEKRPSASEAMKHPWLDQEKVDPQGVCPRASFAPHHARDGPNLPLNSPRKTTFQKFLVMVKVRKARDTI